VDRISPPFRRVPISPSMYFVFSEIESMLSISLQTIFQAEYRTIKISNNILNMRMPTDVLTYRPRVVRSRPFAHYHEAIELYSNFPSLLCTTTAGLSANTRHAACPYNWAPRRMSLVWAVNVLVKRFLAWRACYERFHQAAVSTDCRTSCSPASMDSRAYPVFHMNSLLKTLPDGQASVKVNLTL